MKAGWKNRILTVAVIGLLLAGLTGWSGPALADEVEGK